MSTIDLVSIWIGRGVLVAGVVGMAACVLLGINGLAGLFFWSYARKIGFTAANWDAVSRWHHSGRPEWKVGIDGIYRMVPSTGKFEEPSDA